MNRSLYKSIYYELLQLLLSGVDVDAKLARAKELGADAVLNYAENPGTVQCSTVQHIE